MQVTAVATSHRLVTGPPRAAYCTSDTLSFTRRRAASSFFVEIRILYDICACGRTVARLSELCVASSFSAVSQFSYSSGNRGSRMKLRLPQERLSFTPVVSVQSIRTPLTCYHSRLDTWCIYSRATVPSRPMCPRTTTDNGSNDTENFQAPRVLLIPGIRPSHDGWIHEPSYTASQLIPPAPRTAVKQDFSVATEQTGRRSGT